MLMGLNSEMPSKNLWGWCTEHLSLQCCGHMCHNVLHRVLAATFPRYDYDDDDAPVYGGDDDYWHMLRSIAWRATPCAADEAKRRDLALTCWSVTPSTKCGCACSIWIITVRRCLMLPSCPRAHSWKPSSVLGSCSLGALRTVDSARCYGALQQMLTLRPT